MAKTLRLGERLRRNFGDIESVLEMPYLIETIKDSYNAFLQAEHTAEERKSLGLEKVFREIFPIENYDGTAMLEFVRYEFETPKYDVEECKEKGITYEAPLKLTVQLIVFDVPEEGGEPSIRDIKEQDVYFGTLPLMTEDGTFIVNGTERVIVSQLHRSPGVFFDHDKGKTHSSGKLLYNARIIPYRGSWLDFEFDHKDFVYVRIDRRRKLPITVLLKAMGLDTEQILRRFHPVETVTIQKKNAERTFLTDYLHGWKATSDIKDADGTVIVKKGRKATRAAIRKIEKAGLQTIPMQFEELVGRVAARDHVDAETGEVILELNEAITPEKVSELSEKVGLELELLFIDGLHVGGYIRETLDIDKTGGRDEALIEIYKRLRPGDPVNLQTAREYFELLFTDPDRYDLSNVGRLKLNHKLRRETDLQHSVLDDDDILETIQYLIGLKHGRGSVDDIDHLGNRRVRSVGELLENQYRIGLIRMERSIQERMNLQEVEQSMPHELVNAKPISAFVKEFFGSSELSQFMDQTNPLSEITHKRRLSALGPGGLTRERAGFEVRDVHTTHYGRICPIETPEGPNIGLISSLACYARVNEFGFIETPYRKVVDAKVTDEVIYLSAMHEDGRVIAQANAPLSEDGAFVNELVTSRLDGEMIMSNRDEIDLMDVSPTQLVSVAASLIPFLEHDDANRALMGSNMQRQAVPVIRTNAPIIGTGMEKRVARDSGRTTVVRRKGRIASVDATRIVVEVDPSEIRKGEDDVGVDIYKLIKYERSNQGTCINQVPICFTGQKVEVGDVIADGPGTDMGELALGQNVLVAFMPWRGYNFEDSILVSERVVREDVYTSIHIEEFECVARDTKLGPEEITRDIPNLSEDALRNLDESGIIRIGAEVKPNDILVGKVTPKGETQLSPEEKLLRSIFGAKAGDVRDTSLRVPPGERGTVIDAQVFYRRGVERDQRALEIDEAERERLEKEKSEELAIIRENSIAAILEAQEGTTLAAVVNAGKKTYGKEGGKLTEEDLGSLSFTALAKAEWKNSSKNKEIQDVIANAQRRSRIIEAFYDEKIERLTEDDDLPPGVIKMIKVFIAVKRKLSVGDKMAGRHGNKGVVSMVLPQQDMPFLEDGRPVDIVLNPLGVPSRMNVGQVLEVHLGLGARMLGDQMQALLDQRMNADDLRSKLSDIYPSAPAQKQIKGATKDDLLEIVRDLAQGVHLATPVFDGASEDQIREVLEAAGMPQSGRLQLRDGYTGEAFENDVTVGVMYMMKLHHLVDDKIHARSIGPYSLVTQQPLGGKAQFGGQRLGEMEVWALEAYGAAHCLQEFLTVKSDDVSGRTRMYESIVKGEYAVEPGLPESFHVLVKELMGLGLNVELLDLENQEPGQE